MEAHYPLLHICLMAGCTIIGGMCTALIQAALFDGNLSLLSWLALTFIFGTATLYAVLELTKNSKSFRRFYYRYEGLF